jgi:hypothetical protein
MKQGGTHRRREGIDAVRQLAGTGNPRALELAKCVRHRGRISNKHEGGAITSGDAQMGAGTSERARQRPQRYRGNAQAMSRTSTMWGF